MMVRCTNCGCLTPVEDDAPMFDRNGNTQHEVEEMHARIMADDEPLVTDDEAPSVILQWTKDTQPDG